MGSLKLQSFEDFATASKAAADLKLQEEQKAARTESAYQFETLLSEFGVTSVKDLNEEDRNKFFAKLGASEVSESLAIIEEGTRSQVGIISKRGKIESVYMHYDGYPDHMLPTIKKGYMNSGTVKFLLKKGGGSGLEADPSKINFYGDKTTLKGDAKKIDDYISDASDRAGAEFVYLFDERDGKWYMADVYGDKELIPAFESLIINEAFKPSKGNARDAKKVSKFLNTFFMKHSAIANSDSFLGACRYLLAEALTDANFHSYRDPVSKALGGKIITIMVDIDNLGGMAIPVGKKTIINLLDEHYSGLANAAGWSGIGIVEGMALFLDGFGYSQPAQKIVDAFELIWANESVMNEGNAFLAARAKAIEEDAEDFEFNGKKFPVIKESNEEVEEGNAFGAARAEAIAKGEKTFKVGDEEYDVESVDADDKENAEEFVEETEEVEEGNAFGAARAEAIAKGEKTFKVGDEEFDVEAVDADDKENAEEFVEEETTNEAEVKSDEDFKEYAFSVLQQAFGDEFDEEKAQEVVDGLLTKHDGDYGAAVGALQSSLG
jgi:DNA-directed RNA polymerase subunit K/omega